VWSGTVVSRNQTVICFNTPSGIGQVDVSVSVGGQSSNPLPQNAVSIRSSYSPPTLTAIIPNGQIPTAGGIITVTGSNFGNLAAAPPVAVLGGTTVLTGVQIINHTAFTAMVPAGPASGKPRHLKKILSISVK
jgi:hypothetical protein